MRMSKEYATARQWLKRFGLPFFGVIGVVVNTTQFIQLLRGNWGSATWTLAALSYVSVIVILIHLAFATESSRIYVDRDHPHRVKRYPKFFKAARYGIGCFILLTAVATGLLYRQHQARKGRVVVLVTNFGGDDPSKYRVTEELLFQLHQSLDKYPDTVIVSADTAITEQQGSERARALGSDYHASLVLWGYYGVTSTDILLTVHVENLTHPANITIPNSQAYAAKATVTELNSFQFQERFSQEMSAFALLMSGLVRFEAKNYSEAIVRLSGAINIGKWPESLLTNSILFYYRGAAYALSDDYPAATIDLSQAIKINPQYAEAYNLRGMCSTKLHKLQEAITDYSQAIKINPNASGFYSNRGLNYLFTEDYQSAKSDYSEALRIHPEAGNYYGRGLAYYGLQDYQNAISDLSWALRTADQVLQYNDAYYRRAFSYVALGEEQKAIQDFTRAIQNDPQDGRNFSGRALVYNQQKQYEKALADYSHAIQLNPRDCLAYMGRSTVYASLMNHTAEIADLRQAIATCDSPEVSKHSQELIQMAEDMIKVIEKLKKAEEDLNQFKKDLRRQGYTEDQIRQATQSP